MRVGSQWLNPDVISGFEVTRHKKAQTGWAFRSFCRCVETRNNLTIGGRGVVTIMPKNPHGCYLFATITAFKSPSCSPIHTRYE